MCPRRGRRSPRRQAVERPVRRIRQCVPVRLRHRHPATAALGRANRHAGWDGDARFAAVRRPEQLMAAEPSALGDQYSLAVMVWELLTGASPFMDISPSTMLRAKLEQPLRSLRVCRPELPAELDGVLQRAAAPQPRGPVRQRGGVPRHVDLVAAQPTGDQWQLRGHPVAGSGPSCRHADTGAGRRCRVEPVQGIASVRRGGRPPLPRPRDSLPTTCSARCAPSPS